MMLKMGLNMIENGNKIPVVGNLVGQIAGRLPSFDISNNPVVD